MLTARRIAYSGSSLPGVDVRDDEGKLVASCYGHGQQGERVLRALLETFSGEDVVVSFIKPSGGGGIIRRFEPPLIGDNEHDDAFALESRR